MGQEIHEAGICACVVIPEVCQARKYPDIIQRCFNVLEQGYHESVKLQYEFFDAKPQSCPAGVQDDVFCFSVIGNDCDQIFQKVFQNIP